MTRQKDEDTIKGLKRLMIKDTIINKKMLSDPLMDEAITRICKLLLYIQEKGTLTKAEIEHFNTNKLMEGDKVLIDDPKIFGGVDIALMILIEREYIERTSKKPKKTQEEN